jgi:phosphoenolpyruvate carboxykinase (GTP)
VGAVGNLRRDPFAMLPFCGYNMADYFAHWLTFAQRFDEAALPKLFYVNWFRKGSDGRWLWPGFGENSRVLEWVFNRVDGKGAAETTPIGLIPTMDALNLEGIHVSSDDLRELLNVDRDEWREEIPRLRSHYAQFGDHLPNALRDEVDALEARLA